MDDVNVLVMFYSRGGETERLAVLVAEGAVQAGARIRLRRARDLAAEEVIAGDPDWKAARDRMHEEYAAPRREDAEWADVVALGTPAGPALSPELGMVLERMRKEVALTGKVGTAFSSSYGPRPGVEAAVGALERVLLGSGMIVAPARASFAAGVEDFELARRQGRLAAAVGRALKGMVRVSA